MKIIGIGNIVCDIYYNNGKIIGCNGGKSWANIVFNLSNMGHDIKVIGNCGNDDLGQIALDSLKKTKINISEIQIINKPTNLFHINIVDNEITTKKRCPICQNKTWSDSPIKFKLDPQNIVIIDSIKYLKKLRKQIVMLDIGYQNELELLSDNEFIDFKNFKFEILNINYRVVKYLIERMKIEKEEDLFNYLNTKLLIITKGTDGVSYYFKENNMHFNLSEIAEETDPNGAGDMFFASTINSYIKNDLIINNTFISKSFEEATQLSKEVVKTIGARGYYQELYDAPSTYSNCLCKSN